MMPQNIFVNIMNQQILISTIEFLQRKLQLFDKLILYVYIYIQVYGTHEMFYCSSRKSRMHSEHLVHAHHKLIYLSLIHQQSLNNANSTSQLIIFTTISCTSEPRECPTATAYSALISASVHATTDSCNVKKHFKCGYSQT